MTSQQKAIEKTEGPCIILAGAGTGKTYTIVEKIKHFLENKTYNPEKIVCLTFSNEAANSLKARILPHVPEKKEPIISTFHSFCADLLKDHGDKIQIEKNFRIIIPDDAKILLHKNFKLTPYACHQFVSTMHTAKDLGISLEQFQAYIEENFPNEPLEDLEKSLNDLNFQLQTQYIKASTPEKRTEKKQLKEKISGLDKAIKTKRFINSWKGYEKLKKIKNFLDYSDLNKHALELLQKNPEITKNFDYIIIDEFQDTNKLQLDFLKLLAPHKNITVVGDLNQSIYRFRGAYKENFNEFKSLFNTTPQDIFTLDKSYRSTNKILSIAHELIQNNYSNKEECFPVFSALDKTGVPTEVIELNNNKEETRKIIEIIKQEQQKGTPLEEICVMFRTHQQSRSLKNELEFHQIPFTSVTKKSLFKITPIKITLDYLAILNKLKSKSKGGDHEWWDLIHNSGFNKEDEIIISKFIKQNKEDSCISLLLLNNLQNLSLSEQGKIRTRIILTRIKDLIPHIKKPIHELILDIYKITNLDSDEKTLHGKENILNLQKFHQVAQEFAAADAPDVGSFLHHVGIMNNLNIEIEAPQIENSGVRIMTHHATKGLEYKTIILTNMAQKRFPMEKLSNNPLIPANLSPELSNLINDIPEEDKESAIKIYEQKNQILDERRLCYVAFTRAKNKLYMTYAKTYNNKKFLPSQFLNEINYKQNSNINFQVDNQDLSISQGESAQLLRAASQQEDVGDIKSLNLKFSPSSLQTFDECQKKYEYRYIYNMPDPQPASWEAMKLGSFVHLVFEQGVQNNFKTEKQFLDLAKTIHMQEAWNFIELSEAFPLIKVFFHRNHTKYNTNSLTEKHLQTQIDNFSFQGIADRIDILSNNELEIIDYKTGSTPVKPKYRNWQLGFYALASQSLGTPKRLTLEMLKKEKPLIFEIDSNGQANEISSGRMSFNLNEVKLELVNTAKQILNAYENGFKPCPTEKNCDFCEIYVNGL